MNYRFLQSSSIHKNQAEKYIPLFLPPSTRITDISMNYTTSNIQKKNQKHSYQLQAHTVFTAKSVFSGELEGAQTTFRTRVSFFIVYSTLEKV